MPVKRLIPRQPPASAQTLRDRLIAEWRNPASTAAQPVILEEAGGANQPSHVYVIWDDWRDLGQIERSEIIMDAFESVHGRDRSLNVTVAMGLTVEEADRIGIRYQ